MSVHTILESKSRQQMFDKINPSIHVEGLFFQARGEHDENFKTRAGINRIRADSANICIVAVRPGLRWLSVHRRGNFGLGGGGGGKRGVNERRDSQHNA